MVHAPRFTLPRGYFRAFPVSNALNNKKKHERINRCSPGIGIPHVDLFTVSSPQAESSPRHAEDSEKMACVPLTNKSRKRATNRIVATT